AEHVPGRVKAHRYAVDGEPRAVGNRLRGSGEILAVAQPHQIQRLGGREHAMMSRPGMVGMRMGDERTVDRPQRIDIKSAGTTTKPGGRAYQQLFRTHGRYIGMDLLIRTPCWR